MRVYSRRSLAERHQPLRIGFFQRLNESQESFKSSGAGISHAHIAFLSKTDLSSDIRIGRLAMAVIAKWTRLLADDALPRSSQTLSVVGDSVYIFGGELRPREPVDSLVYQASTKPGELLRRSHHFLYTLTKRSLKDSLFNKQQRPRIMLLRHE